jgi:hypothetical protein
MTVGIRTAWVIVVLVGLLAGARPASAQADPWSTSGEAGAGDDASGDVRPFIGVMRSAGNITFGSHCGCRSSAQSSTEAIGGIRVHWFSLGIMYRWWDANGGWAADGGRRELQMRVQLNAGRGPLFVFGGFGKTRNDVDDSIENSWDAKGSDVKELGVGMEFGQDRRLGAQVVASLAWNDLYIPATYVLDYGYTFTYQVYEREPGRILRVGVGLLLH